MLLPPITIAGSLEVKSLVAVSGFFRSRWVETPERVEELGPIAPQRVDRRPELTGVPVPPINPYSEE